MRMLAHQFGGSMLTVEYERHQQTIEELRALSLDASHRRTRERFLALYEVASGAANATEIARRTGRHHQTVHDWIHLYNAKGPDALEYKRTGGRPPFAQTSSVNSSNCSRVMSQDAQPVGR